MLRSGPGARPRDARDGDVLGDAVTRPGRVVDVTLDAAGGRVPGRPQPGGTDDIEDGLHRTVDDKVMGHPWHNGPSPDFPARGRAEGRGGLRGLRACRNTRNTGARRLVPRTDPVRPLPP